MIDVVRVADQRYYSVAFQDWATLLRLGEALNLPLHHDWIPTYRALTQITRWLQQPGLDQLSPFPRASQARTLVDAISSDLQSAGVTVETYAARGAAFWDAFVEISRRAVRAAQGTGRAADD